MKTVFILVAFILTSNLVSAVSPVNKSRFGGLAIKGYDPVSYFTDSKASKGNKDFEYEYTGATWRFINQKNLDLFKANPESYTPQFGGYCAWAVSQGYTAGIDPDSWKIVEDKLYLNYSKSVQKKWEKDIPGHIVKANENWPKLLEK